MFTFITFAACLAFASAGIIPEHHGLHTYSLPSAHDSIINHHHSGLSLEPTIFKYAEAPTIVKIAEPVVFKSYAPLAESYSNVHQLSYKVPIPHHHGHHAALTVPSYHSSSFALPASYHISGTSLPYSGLSYGHGYGHSYGHGYEHGFGDVYGHKAYGHHHGLLH